MRRSEPRLGQFAPRGKTKEADPETADQEADVHQHAVFPEWNSDRQIEPKKYQHKGGNRHRRNCQALCHSRCPLDYLDHSCVTIGFSLTSII